MGNIYRPRPIETEGLLVAEAGLAISPLESNELVDIQELDEALSRAFKETKEAAKSNDDEDTSILYLHPGYLATLEGRNDFYVCIYAEEIYARFKALHKDLINDQEEGLKERLIRDLLTHNTKPGSLANLLILQFPPNISLKQMYDAPYEKMKPYIRQLLQGNSREWAEHTFSDEFFAGHPENPIRIKVPTVDSNQILKKYRLYSQLKDTIQNQARFENNDYISPSHKIARLLMYDMYIAKVNAYILNIYESAFVRILKYQMLFSSHELVIPAQIDPADQALFAALHMEHFLSTKMLSLPFEQQRKETLLAQSRLDKILYGISTSKPENSGLPAGYDSQLSQVLVDLLEKDTPASEDKFHNFCLQFAINPEVTATFTLSDQDIVDLLNAFFASKGLRYTAQIRHRIKTMSASDGIIKIPANLEMQLIRLPVLLHEMQHLFQRLGQQNQTLHILKGHVPGNLAMTEGGAMIVQNELMQNFFGGPIDYHKLHIIGLQKQLRGGTYKDVVSTIYNHMIQNRNDLSIEEKSAYLQQAMNHAIRLFRAGNYSDSGVPTKTKNTLYAEGYILLQELTKLGLGWIGDMGINPYYAILLYKLGLLDPSQAIHIANDDFIHMIGLLTQLHPSLAA